MERPQVRIIQSQEEQTAPANIDSWEAEQLLRKYGHQPQQFSTHQEPQKPVDNGLTFEQMIAQEEAKLREEEMRRQQMNGPKPISFDGQSGYYTETKYGSDDDSGYGFKIQITSDMPLPPKY